MEDADAQGPSGASLPVFVFPSGIHFFVDEPHSHKQVLTLYNPYDFPLCYKILSTAPRKYSVIEPEGTLKPRCCVDIVIRHLAATVKANVGRSDKFRVQVQKHSEREVTGRKDVQATLHQSRRDAEVSEAQLRFEGTSAPTLRSRSSSTAPQQYSFPPPEYERQSSSQRTGSIGGGGGVAAAQQPLHGQSYLVVLAAIFCIAALMLPTHGDGQANSSSRVPEYLHLSVPQKLVAAYILGLVTMLLMRH
uniref:Major sperm protein n=1 Tax=Plectus sambesii TaxID=2011161 RepID=A0A914V708_9BILA